MNYSDESRLPLKIHAGVESGCSHEIILGACNLGIFVGSMVLLRVSHIQDINIAGYGKIHNGASFFSISGFYY